MLKYEYIFHIKYMEAILSSSTRSLGNCYGLKLAKCRLQFEKNNFIVPFMIILGTLSFPIAAPKSQKRHHSA